MKSKIKDRNFECFLPDCLELDNGWEDHGLRKQDGLFGLRRKLVRVSSDECGRSFRKIVERSDNCKLYVAGGPLERPN